MTPSLIDTCFPDIKILPLHLHQDARGHFLESYRQSWAASLPGCSGEFLQSNVSASRRHVLRGLHFQRSPAQGKLLHVLAGKVYDVVVDVRQASPRFGQWLGFELSSDAPCLLWVPPGYAHGFVTLSDEAVVSYQCTAYYAPQSEACLLWNDPALVIDWPVSQPQVSARDGQGLTLKALAQEGLCL